MGLRAQVLMSNQTPNTDVMFHGNQCPGAKLRGRKGNIPDLRVRSLNIC